MANEVQEIYTWPWKIILHEVVADGIESVGEYVLLGTKKYL